MIRPPPSSTLFPYPTLFRSQAEDGIRDWSVTGVQTYALFCLRSDEHTAELQSLTKLVYGLLLQKQKTEKCSTTLTKRLVKLLGDKSLLVVCKHVNTQRADTH